MLTSIVSITIHICIFTCFLSCALAQDSKQFLPGRCNPSQCQSGCCVNNACAQDSGDCQVGIQPFYFVAGPFIFVFLLAFVTMCAILIRKRRRQASLAVRPAAEVQTTEPTQGDTKQPNLKYARIPINFVEIHAATPMPSTIISPNSRVVEMSQEEFERHMIKDVEEILQKQEKMIKVPRGVQVVILRRNSVIAPKPHPECDERVLTA